MAGISVFAFPVWLPTAGWVGMLGGRARRWVDSQGGEGFLSIEVEAQITGNVWKIETSVGDSVEEEDVLLIIESMKMEIPVEAPEDGRVAEIRVAEGQAVEEGDVLVVLEG